MSCLGNAAAINTLVPDPARAQDSGRLLATSGAVQIDGAGGGGLAAWAPITGYGTRDSVGGDLHDTAIVLPSFDLNSAGAAIGLFDRLELSYAHDWFYTGATAVRLGLPRGFQFSLDTAGIKLRLLGNLVYDQDSWLPVISAGAQFKAAGQHAVLQAIGARSSDGVDAYLAFTKLFLAQSLLVDITLRATRANQFGILGFGGDHGNGYSAQAEGSVALLLTRRFAVGAELRTRPDNLGFAREGIAADIFASWFVDKHVSVTMAVASLGPIARQGDQTGAYLSMQVGF
jgi:hypothetical protein